MDTSYRNKAFGDAVAFCSVACVQTPAPPEASFGSVSGFSQVSHRFACSNATIANRYSNHERRGEGALAAEAGAMC